MLKKKKKEVLQLSHYLNKAAQISYLTYILREKKKKKKGKLGITIASL